jgi:hypothetical protein
MSQRRLCVHRSAGLNPILWLHLSLYLLLDGCILQMQALCLGDMCIRTAAAYCYCSRPNMYSVHCSRPNTA